VRFNGRSALDNFPSPFEHHVMDRCNLEPDCGEKGEYRASDHEREVIRCSEPCGGGKPPENEEKPHENADEARDNRNNM
jgi:hypothetical protein